MHNATKKMMHLQQKKHHTYSKEDDVLVAKKMTCLQQRKQHTSKKIMCVRTKTTMCMEQRRQCATKTMHIALKKNEMRIIKGNRENRRKYEKHKRKTKEEHYLPSHYHYYAVWTMGMNVCCNEDVKCATTPSVELWMRKTQKIISNNDIDVKLIHFNH